MATKKRFEFLEHTGDAYIAAYGKTLEEAFENAALATFEVMTDVEKVEPIPIKIEKEAKPSKEMFQKKYYVSIRKPLNDLF